MEKPNAKLSVTAIRHEESGRITAFFNELPGLVVQARTHEEVKEKLTLLLESYIRRLGSLKGNMEIKTTSLA